VDQRAIDGYGCGVGAIIAATRQLLRLILRLIERQNILGASSKSSASAKALVQ
jgi:hypothetical protein